MFAAMPFAIIASRPVIAVIAPKNINGYEKKNSQEEALAAYTVNTLKKNIPDIKKLNIEYCL